MAKTVTWVLTEVSRTDATSDVYSVENTQTVDVWFGTASEHASLTPTELAAFDIVIINDVDISSNLVESSELRTAVNASGLYTVSNNSAFLGSKTIDLNNYGIPEAAIGFSIDTSSTISNSLNSVLITLDPIVVDPSTIDANNPNGTVTAVFKTGVGNFDPFKPDTLRPPSGVCFAHGTIIQTKNGDKRIEDLVVGDMVYTRNHGYQPLRWKAQKHITSHALKSHPNLRPVCIKKDALRLGVPHKDLIVSQQHRILIYSPIVERIFGQEGTLVPAKHLCHMEGIDIEHDCKTVIYYHLLFDHHEILMADGVASESLYPGQFAMDSLREEERTEIFEIFPDLKTLKGDPETDFPFIDGTKRKQLLNRHLKNGVPLQ